MPFLELPIIPAREYYGTGLMKEISDEWRLRAEGSVVPHVQLNKNYSKQCFGLVEIVFCSQ